MKRPLSRRTFLEVLGVGASAIALHESLMPGIAHAATGEPRFVLVAYMGGGWDQLLAFDPRDQTLPQFTQSQAYTPGTGSGIYPAYDEAALEDAALRATLNTTPVGNGGARTGCGHGAQALRCPRDPAQVDGAGSKPPVKPVASQHRSPAALSCPAGRAS